MLDSVMNGVNSTLESAKEEFLKARKRLEKSLIQFYVASRSHSTSETRKATIKNMKNTYMQELKSDSATFADSLSSSGKGAWIDQAKQAVKEASNLVDGI